MMELVDGKELLRRYEALQLEIIGKRNYEKNVKGRDRRLRVKERGVLNAGGLTVRLISIYLSNSTKYFNSRF